jgi:hypothetical protein
MTREYKPDPTKLTDLLKWLHPDHILPAVGETKTIMILMQPYPLQYRPYRCKRISEDLFESLAVEVD